MDYDFDLTWIDFRSKSHAMNEPPSPLGTRIGCLFALIGVLLMTTAAICIAATWSNMLKAFHNKMMLIATYLVWSGVGLFVSGAGLVYVTSKEID